MSASPTRPGQPSDQGGTSANAPPLQRLQIWLAVLCGFAALACVRALLFPPWPHATPLSRAPVQLQLRQAGLEPQPLASRTLAQSEGVGLSPLLAWRLPQAGELSVTSVHVRRRDDFQVAWITREFRQLALKDRRLDVPGTGMATGRLQGRPAFQTCLVSEGIAATQPAVTLRQLQDAVDRQPRTRGDRLSTVAGLSRTRELRCLLVTFQSTTADLPPLRAWQKTLSALQRFAPRPNPSSPHPF